MEIFKSKQEKFEGDLKIKLCGKRLYPTVSVKYLQSVTKIMGKTAVWAILCLYTRPTLNNVEKQ